MTSREKPKRKALHRGLDDIVRRDASLTSRLLGRVKPIAREPLDLPTDENTADGTPPEAAVSPFSRQESSPQAVQNQPASAVRSQSQAVTPLVSRKAASAPETIVEKQSASQPPLLIGDSSRTSPRGDKNPPAPEKRGGIQFEEFVSRWGFFLRSGNRIGKMRICEVLYNNTYAVGKETYFTSYEKLAKLAGLEKKQCAINIKQLVDLGFVERLNIYNTATRQGTEFKLHLAQLPPQTRKSPRYHHYDEDI